MPAATFLFLLAFLPSASGHGFLTKPKSRNFLARYPEDGSRTTEYCPHCYNGGTVGTVQKYTPGDGLWPVKPTEATSVRHGLGGDPADATAPAYNPFDLAKSNDISQGNTFTQGQSIDVEFDASTH
eukprot:g6176.t1